MRLFFVFVLTALGAYAYGQEIEKASWAFGTNPYYGGVLRYKDTMKKLEWTGLHGIELYANKLTNGRNRWERLFNYPELGVALEYYNYNVPDELGEVVSATSYLDFTLNHTKRNKWRVNIGSGFVYSSKRFDTESNPDNKAVSSRISYVARGTVHYEIMLSENYFFNFNAAFRHYSNGKLNMPNNGMNFPVFGVGIKYIPNPTKVDFIKDTIRYIDRSIKFNVMGAIAWREVLQEDIKHKAFSASLYLSKQITKYNSVLLGIDAFHYDRESMIRALNVYRSKFLPEDFELDYDGRQLAITVGGELLIGKLSVLLQGGFYVYKPQLIYADWYQRYGFKYRVTDYLFLRTTLKAHSRTADMMEFGFGFTL
ncbi:MAG: acyloxyacyl hydrolase [Bacteroidota bacterium]